MSGNIEKLIKPGSSFEHVARWLTFCGAQSPFCNVSEKLPSQAQNDSSQLGVSVLPLLLLLTVLLVLPDNYTKLNARGYSRSPFPANLFVERGEKIFTY